MLGTTSAFAETISIQNSSQFGMTLPQATMPSGQDEIRTSDGTSCRSAVGGNGAYFDSGVIGQPQMGDAEASAAAYGRIVIPLGYQAKRLDCTKLYSLEIERLKAELQLAKMGIAGKANSEEADLDASWANEGWGDDRTAEKEKTKAAKTEVAKAEEPVDVAAATPADEAVNSTSKAKPVKKKAVVNVPPPKVEPDAVLIDAYAAEEVVDSLY